MKWYTPHTPLLTGVKNLEPTNFRVKYSLTTAPVLKAGHPGSCLFLLVLCVFVCAFLCVLGGGGGGGGGGGYSFSFLSVVLFSIARMT